MNSMDDVQQIERRWTAKYEEARERVRDDDDGETRFVLSERCRYLAAIRYKLNRNVQMFRQLLRESAECQVSLYKRFASGHQIARSFVDYATFNQLFDACASCDFDLAAELARLKLDLDVRDIRSFWHGLSRALAAVVADDSEETMRALGQWRAQTRDSTTRNFYAYQDAVAALHDHNEVLFSRSLAHLARSHPAETRKGGEFFESEHAFVAIWIVGICCMAGKRRLPFVVPESPYIPAELTQIGVAGERTT